MSDLNQSLERLQEQSGGQIADGVVGTFVSEKQYNEVLSAEANEPIYVIHDYCNVRVPGNVNANHKALVRKRYPDGREVVVTDNYFTRFPRAWDAFLRGEDLRPVGTLIEDCAAIPRSRVPGLKAAEIRTVEELIHLPDASLRRVGLDARALQRAAAEWIEEQNKPADLMAEMERMRAEIEALKAPKRRHRKKEVVNDGDDQSDIAERGEHDRSSAAG